MFKQSFIKKLSKYNYPHGVFASAIKHYLISNSIAAEQIIDCPCGNGEIAYHLAKLPNSKIVAADISKESIAWAKDNFQRSNIEFVCADIKTVVRSEGKTDVFCIINSL